jgi:hypothetical protein
MTIPSRMSRAPTAVEISSFKSERLKSI